jgi:hypothetical protein
VTLERLRGWGSMAGTLPNHHATHFDASLEALGPRSPPSGSTMALHEAKAPVPGPGALSC